MRLKKRLGSGPSYRRGASQSGRFGRLGVVALVAAGIGLSGAASAQAATIQTFKVDSANASPGDVSVLLPNGYNPANKYRVVYMIHGNSGDNTTFTKDDAHSTNMSAKADELNSIIVAPSLTIVPIVTDPVDGNQKLASYFLKDLMPAISSKYSISDKRSDHVLIGGSSGGFTSTYLAAQRPDYFGIVGTLSGNLDTDNWVSGFAVSDSDRRYGRSGTYTRFGTNPVNLASNLADSKVYVRNGNGWFSDVTPKTDPLSLYGMLIEFFYRPMSDKFADTLKNAGVNVTHEFKSGAHTWPDLMAQLDDFTKWLSTNTSPVSETAPSKWTYIASMDSGNIWGIDYKLTSAPAAGTSTLKFVRDGNNITVYSPGGNASVQFSNGSQTVTANATAAAPATVTVP